MKEQGQIEGSTWYQRMFSNKSWGWVPCSLIMHPVDFFLFSLKTLLPRRPLRKITMTQLSGVEVLCSVKRGPSCRHENGSICFLSVRGLTKCWGNKVHLVEFSKSAVYYNRTSNTLPWVPDSLVFNFGKRMIFHRKWITSAYISKADSEMNNWYLAYS